MHPQSEGGETMSAFRGLRFAMLGRELGPSLLTP